MEENEEDVIEVEGRVIQVLPGTMFRIELINKHVVLGTISGKLRKNFIKINVGDHVRMEMSPTNIEKARIVYRLKNPSATAGARPPVRRPGGHGRR